MEFSDSRMDTVCFTGHRPEKLTQGEERVRSALRKGIDRALRWKYTTFITGMAQGVDLWAADEILALRKDRPEIKLICAIPFKGYADKWDPEWKEKYETVRDAADEVYFVCPRNVRGAPVVRDKWMVDHSSLVIAVYNGGKGGTKTTIDYAVSKKTRVLNVLEVSDPVFCSVQSLH